MTVNMDCRHFRGDRPCIPHKHQGVRCGQCEEYDPLTKKILIIKLAADGDVLRTTCLLPALKQEYTGCHITWVTASSAAPLLDNNPLVDRILSPPERFLPVLMAGSFDITINTDADILCSSLASLARGKEKRGFVLDDLGNVHALSEPAQEWFQLGLWDDLKRANRRSYPIPDLNCICCYLADCDLSPACNELLTPEQITRSLQKGLILTRQVST